MGGAQPCLCSHTNVCEPPYQDYMYPIAGPWGRQPSRDRGFGYIEQVERVPAPDLQSLPEVRHCIYIHWRACNIGRRSGGVLCHREAEAQKPGVWF